MKRKRTSAHTTTSPSNVTPSQQQHDNSLKIPKLSHQGHHDDGDPIEDNDINQYFALTSTNMLNNTRESAPQSLFFEFRVLRYCPQEQEQQNGTLMSNTTSPLTASSNKSMIFSPDMYDSGDMIRVNVSTMMQDVTLESIVHYIHQLMHEKFGGNGGHGDGLLLTRSTTCDDHNDNDDCMRDDEQQQQPQQRAVLVMGDQIMDRRVFSVRRISLDVQNLILEQSLGTRVVLTGNDDDLRAFVRDEMSYGGMEPVFCNGDRIVVYLLSV